MCYLYIFDVLLAPLGLSHISNKFYIISLRKSHFVGHLDHIWELLSFNFQILENLG